MRILITGGSGLIGTNLSRLLSKSHEVVVFDRRKSKANNVDFKEGNIQNTEENPVITLDTNIIGTKNVLEACRINDVKKILFSSSSEIYGEPLRIPIEESDNPIPITTYGVSKLAAEEYIKSYAKVHGIKYTIFRLFNVYGEEQINEWVVPEFVGKAIKNEDILLHGDGTQIRAFCYVSDVSNAFQLALNKGDNDIFNIGNDSEPLTIKELAQKIISIANSKSSIKFLSFAKSNRNRNEILTRVPSIEKAKTILGYQPGISLNKGITIMLNKLKFNYNISH